MINLHDKLKNQKLFLNQFTQKVAIDKSFDLINNLNKFNGEATIEETKSSIIGIIKSLGNVANGLSSPLNTDRPFLNADIVSSGTFCYITFLT